MGDIIKNIFSGTIDTREIIVIAATILFVLLCVVLVLLFGGNKKRKKRMENSIFLGRKNMYKDRTRRKHKF